MIQQIDSILGQITGIYSRIPYTGKFLTRRFKNLSKDVKALSDNETLAQDTIRIALNIAGYDIENMSQFERASAILNVVQEYAAIKPYADGVYLTDYIREVDGELFEPVVWKSIDKGDTMTE